jgi:hypothetical protein
MNGKDVKKLLEEIEADRIAKIEKLIELVRNEIFIPFCKKYGAQITFPSSGQMRIETESVSLNSTADCVRHKFPEALVLFRISQLDITSSLYDTFGDFMSPITVFYGSSE